MRMLSWGFVVVSVAIGCLVVMVEPEYVPSKARDGGFVIPCESGGSVEVAPREATLREYATFVAWIAETGDHSFCDPREGAGRDHQPMNVREEFFADPDGPVVGIDWFDALGYSRWMGGRLPTVAEWSCVADSLRPAVRARECSRSMKVLLVQLELPKVRWVDAHQGEVGAGIGGGSLRSGVSEWCAEQSSGAATVPTMGGNWYLGPGGPECLSWRARTYRHSTLGVRCVRTHPNKQRSR